LIIKDSTREVVKTNKLSRSHKNRFAKGNGSYWMSYLFKNVQPSYKENIGSKKNLRREATSGKEAQPKSRQKLRANPNSTDDSRIDGYPHSSGNQAGPLQPIFQKISWRRFSRKARGAGRPSRKTEGKELSGSQLGANLCFGHDTWQILRISFPAASRRQYAALARRGRVVSSLNSCFPKNFSHRLVISLYLIDWVSDK
jgi:hypothetical protein